MMNATAPPVRKDLEFFPVRHGGQQLVLIRDHLGLVQEGKAVAPPLYKLMTLLDGTRTLRDLQMALMREKGGVLVGMDEVQGLLRHLDESYLLDTEGFKKARERIVAGFTSKGVRPCSHCGRAYPDDPSELKNRLEEIMASQSNVREPRGKVTALVAPHIDLSVGYKTYSIAYHMLRYTTSSRIIVLGVGHQMPRDLFCLTDKVFETPVGVVECEKSLVDQLRGVGGDLIGADDFPHRSEHSIEFQLIFLQHLLQGAPFTIVPILCGPVHACMPEYSREAYLEKASPFLSVLKEIMRDPGKETLLVAGVDLSHIGPKFGHEMPAQYLKSRSEAHDKALLQYLSVLDPAQFWEESKRVEDRFNVCGFSALACLLEVLPPSRGQILDYRSWNEEATQSAVSFAAVVFTLERR